ncbi:hypothetical protein CDAR_189141 [Caerostris darwini]|uniref:Uncharacterized protein n=1 Tax=Caerostris darwini TaxID=1538125 RepID=A0AAV4SPM9_9ARAC|nr:hypothetical protein CDAR_189141 [Caerostris darwini]
MQQYLLQFSRIVTAPVTGFFSSPISLFLAPHATLASRPNFIPSHFSECRTFSSQLRRFRIQSRDYTEPLSSPMNDFTSFRRKRNPKETAVYYPNCSRSF